MVLRNHDSESILPWVARFASLVPEGARVLDYACGSGRHARYFAARGAQVDAVDRDELALASLKGVAGVNPQLRDLEDGDWPFEPASYDVLIVTRYLHRPRFDAMLSLLAEGGVLIYETFMEGNERHGRPRSPDFLLKPNELLERTQDSFSIVAFEQGELGTPPVAVVQRLCAIRGRGRIAGLPG